MFYHCWLILEVVVSHLIMMVKFVWFLSDTRDLLLLTFAVGKLLCIWTCSHHFAVICTSFMVNETILMKYFWKQPHRWYANLLGNQMEKAKSQVLLKLRLDLWFIWNVFESSLLCYFKQMPMSTSIATVCFSKLPSNQIQMAKSQVLLKMKTWSMVHMKGIWKQFVVLFCKNVHINFSCN